MTHTRDMQGFESDLAASKPGFEHFVQGPCYGFCRLCGVLEAFARAWCGKVG